MEKGHRDILRKNRVDLSRDLDGKQATQFLYSRSILSETDKQEIDAKTTSANKSDALLDILPKRGPNAFNVFLEFLAENQQFLFKLLQPESVAEERSGPSDNIDSSASPPLDSRPPNVAEEYNPTSVDVGMISTDTQVGGISSTSNDAGESGSDQGDGNKSSTFKYSPSSQKDGVNREDIYPMRGNPYKGKAFIINNKIFKPSSGMDKYPRNGTDVDAAELEQLFQSFGFETKRYNNQTTKQTMDIADLYSHANYSRYDCFMCAVLTHGEEGLIFSTDGKLPIKEFTSKFRSKQLIGKPKLFFFQACQGFEYMDGADQPDGPAMPDVDEVDSPGNNNITLPVEADFLYAYSTVPGYYSWRNSVRGSWFAQAIVAVFTKHAGNMDVMRMLTRVNKIVAEQSSNTNDSFSDNKKQIPSIISQLRKELYFFPEHVVDCYDGKNETSTERKKSCSVS